MSERDSYNDTPLGFRRWEWLRAHRGLFRTIAAEQSPAVSPDYVRKVFWGLRSSASITAALREAGAPIDSIEEDVCLPAR